MNRSNYEDSLYYMLKSFHVLVNELQHYRNHYAIPSQLSAALDLWLHPKGIPNLVRTLGLEYKSKEDPQPPQCSPVNQPTLPIILNPNVNIPQAYKTEVKVEEEEISQGNASLDPVEEKEDFQDRNESYGDSESMEKQYKRGPYKSYSMEEKAKAVHMLLHDRYTLSEVSKKLQIPCKNIKRWSTQGVLRKRGGGRRRSSPSMQQKTYRWIMANFQPYEVIPLDKIQEFALSCSQDINFKASRGWVLKFLERHSLRGRFAFV